jgi:hypothetical protein
MSTAEMRSSAAPSFGAMNRTCYQAAIRTVSRLAIQKRQTNDFAGRSRCRRQQCPKGREQPSLRIRDSEREESRALFTPRIHRRRKPESASLQHRTPRALGSTDVFNLLVPSHLNAGRCRCSFLLSQCNSSGPRAPSERQSPLFSRLLSRRCQSGPEAHAG